MNFIISYEDAKKILEVFYNSTYKQVLPYVEIMHGLCEEKGSLSLKERLDLEQKALQEAIKKKENEQNGNQ